MTRILPLRTYTSRQHRELPPMIRELVGAGLVQTGHANHDLIVAEILVVLRH